MDTKEAIDEKINLLLNLKSLYNYSNKPNYSRIINDCINAIQRSDKYKSEVRKLEGEYVNRVL